MFCGFLCVVTALMLSFCVCALCCFLRRRWLSRRQRAVTTCGRLSAASSLPFPSRSPSSIDSRTWRVWRGRRCRWDVTTTRVRKKSSRCLFSEKKRSIGAEAEASALKTLKTDDNKEVEGHWTVSLNVWRCYWKETFWERSLYLIPFYFSQHKQPSL